MCNIKFEDFRCVKIMPLNVINDITAKPENNYSFKLDSIIIIICKGFQLHECTELQNPSHPAS